MTKTKKTAAEVEADKMVAEVTRDVQMLYGLSVLPNVFFTTLLVLAIPTAWFHSAVAMTGDNVAASMGAWALGIAAALFAGRLVPQVPIDNILVALGGSAQTRGDDRFDYLTKSAKSEQD